MSGQAFCACDHRGCCDKKIEALLSAAKEQHAKLVAPGSHNEYVDCCRLSREIANAEARP